MQTFSELAERYKVSAVRTKDENLIGFLHLEDEKSKAVLSSKEFTNFTEDENGWFDLELIDQRGSLLLLHNSLFRSRTMPGLHGSQGSGFYTSEVFANVIVIGAQHLRSDRTLQSLSFQFESCANFFVHDLIEWHSFHSTRNEVRASTLEAIRSNAWIRPKDVQQQNDIDDLSEIYILHKSRTYIDFVIEDMRVKVWHGRSHRGSGWTGHEIRILPTVTISFSKSITIDEAIERIWIVKSFFDQLSTSNLQVTAISFSKFKKGWPSADIYLPHEASRTEKRNSHLHPSQIPYSTWKDRKKFAASFQRWLTLSHERRFFRSVVSLSIRRTERSSDDTLIPLLMAGIESLPELSEATSIQKQTIKLMAKAAHEVAPEISETAIRSLIGAFRRTSPKRRLQKVAETSFIIGDENDIADLIKSAGVFRNKIAHGEWMSDPEHLAAGRIANVLAYLCIIYDLQTSGFPLGLNDPEAKRIIAHTKMNWAWQSYKLADEGGV